MAKGSVAVGCSLLGALASIWEIGQVFASLSTLTRRSSACFNEFVEASPAVLWRHPIIIREIGGSGDAVGSACAVEEFTLSVLLEGQRGVK